MASLVTTLTLLAAGAGAGGAPVLRVDTAADAAQLCAAGDELAEAIRARLPAVRVATAGASDRGDLVASLTESSGEVRWRLSLRDHDGTALLGRRINAPPGDCSAVAAAAALIIDRFLGDIRWPGLGDAIDPKLLVPELPPPPLLRRWSVEAGTAVAMARGARPNVGGYVEATATSRWAGLYGGLRISAFAAHRHPVRALDPLTGPRRLGRLYVQSTELLAGLGRCWGTAASLCATLHGGAGLTRLVIRGRDLYTKRPRTDVEPLLGSSLRVSYPLAWRLRVAGSALGVAHLAPVRYRVEGLAEPPYAGAAARLVVAVGMAYTFE